MKKDFILPDIGEGIVECEVIQWKVKEGDLIEEDQVVVDVSTDKAIVEIPSMYSGRVTKLYCAESEIAKVHQPLFAIDIAEDCLVSEASAEQKSTKPEPAPATVTQLSPAKESKVLTTPAVRKMAREHSIDLSKINGSGKQGRILKEDILNYLQQPAASQSVVINHITDRREPIKGVRKIMAQRMADSMATIPHFTFVEEFDVTELIALRRKLADNYGSEDLKITLMPLFIKALSLAMLEFPLLNSRANQDFTELTYLASHNIGMAVDGKTGLLVPNIKDVQQLSLLEVAQEVSRLTSAARTGIISPADLAGGTITLSNLGVIGGTAAMTIINKPEVAIVALGKIQRLPRFDSDNNVVARSILTVSWSGDHRVIDGGTLARFNNIWKQYLEDPQSLLLALLP